MILGEPGGAAPQAGGHVLSASTDDTGDLGSTIVLESPDVLYSAATQAIKNADDRFPTIDLAALHGHAERREIAQSSHSKALMEAMLARVAQGWRFRRLVSITTAERFERELTIIGHMDERGPARVEIRVLVTDSVPVLAPLVIGRSMAFLAAEDPRDFGVYESLMFRDADSIAFCTRYFDSLWSDDRAVRLRTQAGLRQAGVERIRDQLRAFALGSLVAVDDLHQEIRDRCASLYDGGNYAEAVEKSFKVVRDRLRALTGYETGSEAFGKGRLRINGASAPHVADDFNEAAKFLAMAIDKFRNEKAHTADGRIDDPARAAEYLSMSSLAMRLLDGPEVPL